MGVFQELILSCLLYIIYTLDINKIKHEVKHQNNISEYECKQTKIEAFVDDTYGIIKSNKNEIWKNIESYVFKLNFYYINNGLKNNISKTNMMLITKKNHLKTGSIVLENEIIKHSQNIKVLGTTFNNVLAGLIM